MLKWLSWFPSLIDLIVWLINKYNSNKVETERENIRNDAASEWVDGFGVRREKSDPTKTNSEP